MPQPIEIPQGVYDHYRGGKYRVLFVANDSTNGRDGKKVVVYVSLSHGTVNVRDLDEFTEIIEWPDGSKKSRFVGAFTSFKKRLRKT